ncbi:hypothetical protein GQ600_14987 [Phytophthora cactorum]|nr:hypothetical protein GQ600_14987 [Phytophthora cactorum]
MKEGSRAAVLNAFNIETGYIAYREISTLSAVTIRAKQQIGRESYVLLSTRCNKRPRTIL